MWKNNVEPGRPEMTIWCIRFACWMSTCAHTHTHTHRHTHSGYEVLIALPLQQLLRECALVLRYMYIALSIMPYLIQHYIFLHISHVCCF